jgi:ribosomal protein S18 acetylase RimI-like enzyme
VTTSKSIRRAAPEDISVLTEIRNDAFANKLAHGDYAWGKKMLTDTDVLNILSRSFARKEVYVVEQEGVPVATFTLCLDGERSDITTWGSPDPLAAYVHRICVRKGFNGRGLGSYIVDWCAHELSSLNRRFLRLDCDVRNATLCAYYESLGFIRVGTKSTSEDGDYIASLYERFAH